MFVDDEEGRHLVFGCLEITAIPDKTSHNQTEDAIKAYCTSRLCQDIVLFLSEQRRVGVSALAEILMYAVPTVGQLKPYSPRLLLNIYSPHPNIETGKHIIRKVLNTLSTDLTEMGYEYQEVKDINHYDQVLNPLIFNREIVSISPKSHACFEKIPEAALTHVATMMQDMPDTSLSLLFGGLDGISADFFVSAPNKTICDSFAWEFARHYENALLQPFHVPTGAYMDYLETRTSLFNRFCKPIDEQACNELLRLPSGLTCGLPTSKPHDELPPFPSEFINGEGIPFGTVRSTKSLLTIPLHKKTTHLSVIGSSGSGKSTFLLNLLKDLWNKSNIPFLVIDPVTTEYRRLRKELLGQKLNVFTPGSSVSPFVFNPFALPTDGLTISEYKNILIDFILNSFEWGSPLDKLLPEAIDDAFSKKGWYDESTLTHYNGYPLNVEDFGNSFFSLIREREMSEEQRQSCLSVVEARLRVMKRRFDTYAPLPIEDICQIPTVIELESLHDTETKCLTLLYVLSMVKSYILCHSVNLHQLRGAPPQLLIVIDEAHSVLEVINKTEWTNKAQRGAVNMINRMLLEFRKYGLSVILADQRASVLLEIMENTHTQVVFKLHGGNEEVSRIIGLDDADKLRTLITGEAYVRTDKLDKPVMIHTQNYISPDVDDCTVEFFMKQASDSFWQTHKALTKPYPQCIKCPLTLCDTKIRAFSRDILRLSNAEKDPYQVIGILDELSPDGSTLSQYLPKELQQDTARFYDCTRVQLLHLRRATPLCLKLGCAVCNEEISRSAFRRALQIYKAYCNKPAFPGYHLDYLLNSCNATNPEKTEQLRRCIRMKLSKLVEGKEELGYLLTQ